jgi:putative Mg2+ transporter-C (MgtC) family protein
MLSYAMEIDVDSVLRMVAAVVFGGAIGFNRDIHGKPTGIRAHALVSLGAAIVMLAGSGAYIGGNHPDAMSRVIQGIIAGIGFLGAGVILRGATGMQVYHLVTASSLWVTTGIGVLCGMGAYLLAGLATVLVLFVLVFGLRLDRWLYGKAGVQDDDRA